jgi:CubicO group peptidase (beta-lactamase class C family)
MDRSVEGFVAAAGKLGVHGFVLERHGETVAEGWWHPYEPDQPQTLYSLSKAFTSTAVGFAVGEGLLSVDDHVADLLSGADQRPDNDLRGMRVRHLLTMTTGHDSEAVPLMAADPDDDWVRGFLGVPVVHEPGTRFVYNSGATYTLSAIVQRLTGETVLDYLRPRLFEPLGFGPATWDTCPRGVNLGGWGLRLRTADLARFGRLYLDGGRWQGRQLLPAAWAEAATAWQVPSVAAQDAPDWRQGYGYQFWRCRHGAYRADGAFGQFVVVMPAQDAVLAITAGTTDLQGVLDAVWTHLLDAVPAPQEPPRLEGLRLPALTDTAEPDPDLVGRRFRVTEPPALPRRGFRPPIDQPSRISGFAMVRAPHGWLVELDDEHGEHRFRCDPGRWHRSTLTTSDGEVHPVATTGGWRDPATFELRVCQTAEPCVRTYTARFDAGGVTIVGEDSVGFDFTVHPPVRAS